MLRQFLGILLLIVAAKSRAQVAYTFTSFEAQLGTSQTVAVGHVVGVTSFTIPPSEGNRCETKGFEVAAQIDERLKGKGAQKLTLRMAGDPREGLFRRWQIHKTKLLFVVQPDPSDWSVYRLGKELPEEEGLRAEYTMMFSMDLVPLESPEAILRAARSFVKEHPGAVPMLKALAYPPVRLPNFHPPGDGNSLVLPDVPEVKIMAQEMVDHPERWLDRLASKYAERKRVQDLGRSILAAKPRRS